MEKIRMVETELDRILRLAPAINCKHCPLLDEQECNGYHIDESESSYPNSSQAFKIGENNLCGSKIFNWLHRNDYENIHPCPTCGKYCVSVVPVQFYGQDIRYIVECNSCRTLSHVPYHNPQEAIEDWNDGFVDDYRAQFHLKKEREC